jgi:NAD(P)-dependent dehydrogenase (short-subunit alcohol dehydrogenase family)
VLSQAREHKADLRTVELDVQSDASVRSAIAQIVSSAGRLDVIVHNAGHIYIDPSQDRAEEVFRVGDRIRREMFRYIRLQDLLTPPHYSQEVEHD